jgi:phage terminase small subunit
MQGRKPAIKPLGDVVELPASAVRIPPYPKTLPEGLPRECWDDVTRQMVAKNTYDADCRDLVEAYCIQRARFIEANRKAIEFGTLTVKSKRGKSSFNPYITLSNNAHDRMFKLALELGLSPVMRGRAVRAGRGARAGAVVSPSSKYLKSVLPR